MSFLRNNVFININRDVFLNHHFNIYFDSKGYNTIKGYDADLHNMPSHITSSIGEYFEREVLINRNPSKETSIKAISLIDCSTIDVPLSKIVFYNSFVDSMGMASHTDSDSVIWSAYKEYFERQSYISNYLFELNSTEIIIDINPRLQELDSYLKNYLDDIRYFDISLDNSIHVVLALGIGKNTKAAGLGTSRNIDKSIEKAQLEILQYYAVSGSKHYTSRVQIKIPPKDQYLYKFDTLAPHEFIALYNYLWSKTNPLLLSQLSICNNTTPIDIICKMDQKYKMHPYICVFREREELSTKTIKIYDESWFPSMMPSQYNETILNRLSLLFNKRPRKVSFLPFA